MSDDIQSNRNKMITAAVNDAIREERRRSEEIVLRLKTQHSEAVLALLKSTSNALENKVAVSFLESDHGAGVNAKTKEAVDDILKNYFSESDTLREQVKGDLAKVKEKHNGMKDFDEGTNKSIVYLDTLKVLEIRKMLQSRGLKSDGKKITMLRRL